MLGVYVLFSLMSNTLYIHYKIERRSKLYLALVYTDCVHIFVIIACSEGLSRKKNTMWSFRIIPTIPSGDVKESLKGYNRKEEGLHPH